MRAVVLHDDAADLHATWVPGAGMLGSSLVHRGEELLWQGDGPAGYAGARKFMGIPFLHPWANRLDDFGYSAGGHDVELDPGSPLLLRDEHGLPIHGILTASRRWSVREAVADEEGARLVAALDFDSPELLDVFPFPHHLEMDVRVRGAELEVCTHLTPTGDRGVPVAFGFHPYLRVPGTSRAEWEVDFPVRRRLCLDHRGIPTRGSEAVPPITGVLGERTWDDAFDRFEGAARFEVRGGPWAIDVEFGQGYRVAQIFAPPGEEYVCVEPMTAPANALAGPDTAVPWVQPGQRGSARFRIACRHDDRARPSITA
jgi:aldose 1-epimerase